ncbi:2-phosphosulfolactate phosphatase [Bacillus sp. SA1-12]|uniref:2-phosphosulfolactate phosphatase n=1 Tax=Bacillus sp. SA1-12 TaxID=1455638 RepID=UPI000626EE6C|nr:2-phosphosulfolactate phosphatase [Bacillus sp. SA1-12]KKI90094.1 2-phosphosulfolactate phosphatase [Bacillus sp. SA1-12]
MLITIYQGNDQRMKPSDVNVVIDVIRAFTVAHYAFLKGVKEIWLVGSVESAINLKEHFTDILLAGEVRGLPISGFDLDNSPATIANHKDLNGKVLVQKTTNGVKAALNALNAKEIYVTGFSNAKTTAEYIKKKWTNAEKQVEINIVASHPLGDDDLACAEYLKNIIEEDKDCLSKEEVINRIQRSCVTEKFFDPEQKEFNPVDIEYCVQELNSPFIMRINKTRQIPTIERVDIY